MKRILHNIFFSHIQEFNTKVKSVFYFTLIYIFLFTIHAIIKKNGEFIFYAITMLVLLEIGIYANKQVNLPEIIILGLSILGFIHILGGNIQIGDTRLYETFFLGGLIRYDNIVHFFGSMMSTLVLNSLFFSYSINVGNIKLGLYYCALTLMALGVGVINEIIELIAVIFINAEEGVGGYINNTVDLVYNLIGALIAIILIDTYRLYKSKK